MLSPKGDRLVFTSSRGRSTGLDLYEKPLTGVVEEKRLLDRAGSEIPTSSGQFSPDGRWVAYSSDETGRTETGLEVGAARPLFKTQFRGATLAYAVTADGRFLVNRAVDDERPMPESALPLLFESA